MAKKKASKKTTKKTPKKAATKKAAKKTTKKAAKKVTKKAAPKAKATKKAAPKIAKTTAKPAAKKAAAPKATSGTTHTPTIHVGERVPGFEAHATGNKTVRLEDLKNHKVVLYFYPKDDTPGCTLEGQDFTRLNDRFKENNTVVFGISRDDVACHERFKAKYSYAIDLIADEDERLCNMFGVMKDKNMYGKMVRGIERSTFVLDENGVLIKEWRGVSVPGHAEEVLNFVSTQKKS